MTDGSLSWQSGTDCTQQAYRTARRSTMTPLHCQTTVVLVLATYGLEKADCCKKKKRKTMGVIALGGGIVWCCGATSSSLEKQQSIRYWDEIMQPHVKLSSKMSTLTLTKWGLSDLKPLKTNGMSFSWQLWLSWNIFWLQHEENLPDWRFFHTLLRPLLLILDSKLNNLSCFFKRPSFDPVNDTKIKSTAE